MTRSLVAEVLSDCATLLDISIVKEKILKVILLLFIYLTTWREVSPTFLNSRTFSPTIYQISFLILFLIKNDYWKPIALWYLLKTCFLFFIKKKQTCIHCTKLCKNIFIWRFCHTDIYKSIYNLKICQIIHRRNIKKNPVIWWTYLTLGVGVILAYETNAPSNLLVVK